MTSYNSSKYIKEQLDSIFPQLQENDEIIICDDCSKDNTIEIISSYKDPRIKLYNNETNLGPNHNFEKCLSKANGDIIVISDSDNVWLPGKIDKIIPFFDNRKVNMVMHDAIITNERLEPIMDSYFAWRKSKPGLLRNIIKNGYGGSMMAFRSSCLEHILPFPKKMPFFFDEWVGMMCEKYGKCIFINEKLSYWRRHNNVVSSLNTLSNQQSSSDDRKRGIAIKSFFSRIYERLMKIKLAITR